jgi:hypothetical protein
VMSLSIDGTSLLLLASHSAPLVRPDDVLAALGRLAPDFQPSEVPLCTRLRQGTLNSSTGEIDEPASTAPPER